MKATAEIIILEPDAALALLKVRSHTLDNGTIERDVHTFVNPGGMLIGANWQFEDVEKLFRVNGGAEVTGPQAQAVGHGLAARDGGRLVFFETVNRTDTND